jgi:hypothetical protein
MSMKLIMSMLATALVAGCGYDMTHAVWSQATELCQPHGGLVAADHDRFTETLDARCASGIIIEARVKR